MKNPRSQTSQPNSKRSSCANAAGSVECEGHNEQSETASPRQELFQEEFRGREALLEAIERRLVGPAGLRAVQLQLIIEFGRIQSLGEEIARAFSGIAFRLDRGPTCPENRRRFNACIGCFERHFRLLKKAIELWAFTCGMKPDEEWAPMVIVEMDRQAAKAQAEVAGPRVMEKLRVMPNPAAGARARTSPRFPAERKERR